MFPFDLISYQSWLEIGLSVSFVINLILGILTIGILFPRFKLSQKNYNRDLLNIAIGGLFALLGSFFVAAMVGDIKEPMTILVAFGSFIGILCVILYGIFNPSP